MTPFSVSSSSALALLLQAGWTPAHQVPLPPALLQREAPEHPALAVLASLGDLQIGDCTAGLECASSDLAFGWLQDSDDDATFMRWQVLLGTRLIGIAEVHHAHGMLLMAADGRCFGMSYVHDAFYFEGETLDMALERLLTGRRALPMLKPEQPSVSLYGDVFTHSHPGLYRY